MNPKKGAEVGQFSIDLRGGQTQWTKRARHE
jgi:hypothetical protein